MEKNSGTKRFTGLFGFVARHPRLILAVALLLSVLSVIYTKERMEFLTGRDDLMPKNAPFQQDYRAIRAEFGDREEIAVVIESADAAAASRFGERLQEKLAADRTRFREVFFPGGMPFFKEHGLLLMPLEDIRNLRKNFTMAKPVLKELATSPTVQTLFTHLTGRMDAYVAGGGKGGEAELAGITFMLDKLGTGIDAFGGGKKGSFSLEEVFLGGDSALARAGRMQILTVRPVKDPGSFVPAVEAIGAVRKEVKALRALPEFAGVTVGLTGTPVLEYEEMATSERDITIATVLSLALTVVLLLLAFRGFLNVMAAMVTLIVALCVSFGLATLVVGHLNILSMVFAIMLIGIGIEYGIQVVLRYQEELGLGEGELEAISTGLNRNIWAIVMAASTIAAAFFTFVFTDFKGISELGIIAALGVCVCVLATFTVLPAVLVLLAPYRKRKEEEREARAATILARSSRMKALERFLFGHPKTVIGITLILCAASIYPLVQTRFDYNLMNLQAKGLEPVEYAYKLMRSKENSGYFAEVVASSAPEARELTRRLEALPAVDHVVSLATFVPDDQEAKIAELAALRRELADVKPAPYEEDLRVMELPTVFENFRNSVERLKLYLEKEQKPEAKRVGAFLATLDRFFATLEKEKDKNALGMLRDFQGGMLASFPEKIGMFADSLAVTPVTEADIPPQLRKLFVGKSGKYLLQVAPKEEIFEREPLKRFLDQVRSVAPRANGEPVMVYESMTIMRDAYLRAFVYAFAAIVVILFVTFRSVTYTLVGLVPLVVGILLMVGGMWLFGISFNSANIIVMPLILGIAVDSGIYIINRFRREDGDAASVITGSTGLGVVYNTLTIMASFGALMVAHHQGVFSIGAVMSLGMVACQAAFVLVLPAVLTLVKGRDRGPGTRFRSQPIAEATMNGNNSGRDEGFRVDAFARSPVPGPRSRGLSGAVQLAHFFLQERLRPGDRAVDATCGNGHDTLFLAQLVGPQGRVWAFDVQAKALAATEERLAEAGCRDRVALVHGGHERLAEVVTGPVRAVVFNLGFLPGAPRETVTTPETTIAGLEQAAALLLPGGLVTVAVYTGHPGGADEGAAVEDWAAALPPGRFNVWHCRQGNRSGAAPYLLIAERVPA